MFVALGCVGFIASAPARAAEVEGAAEAEVAADSAAYDDQQVGQTITVTGARDDQELESPKATQQIGRAHV